MLKKKKKNKEENKEEPENRDVYFHVKCLGKT